MTEQPRDNRPQRQPRVRRSRRISLALATVGTLTAAILGFAASPASAAPAGCSSTYFCFYADPDYSGGMGKVQGNNRHFSAFNTSTHNCGNGNWNDCVSSAYNNGTQCTVFLWSDADYRGRVLALARGQGYRNLRSVNFDDVLSSNHWCTQR
jgi:hypothetical protein